MMSEADIIQEPVGAKVISETATISSVLSEADFMFEYVQSKVIDCQDDAIELYDILYEKHKNFVQTYPIVVRYMMAGAYDREVLRLHLESVAKSGWVGEDQFLRSSADYAGRIHRHKTKCSRSDGKKVRQHVYKEMKRMAQDIKDKAKKGESEFSRHEETHKRLRKRATIQILREHGAEPVPVRVDPATMGSEYDASLMIKALAGRAEVEAAGRPSLGLGF